MQLALGLCRSCVKSAGAETSATLQPFYTLQLDIQHSNVTSVMEALNANFAAEQLDGYICSKTKLEVEASRAVSLEDLPPILILHLKRFVYDSATGGVQKVMKHVEFSVDLEISRDILSQSSRSKFTLKQRQYKLFAVVYHNGREATKGHYVADVYHTGYANWLHCDDSIIKPTAEALVTAPNPNSVPYILFYRRCDTMVGVDKTQK
jgi:ubiquitin carboxyl-terminal hydrolase 10